MERSEHYAPAEDGTRLRWSSLGPAGAPDRPAVLLSDGIGCAGYIWRALEPALARRRRVLHWNYRGHGGSERPVEPEQVSVAHCARDLLTVLDEAGERRAVLVGHSFGVQVALEAHRLAPRRVAGLVLICGSAGHLLDTFHDVPGASAALPYWQRAVEAYPGVARFLARTVIPSEAVVRLGMAYEVNARQLSRQDLERYLADLADVDSPLFVRLLASAAAHDASGHLPEVAAPTLVLAGEKDTFTPARLSVALHEAIPGSELLVVPGGTHVLPLEQPALCEGRIEAFLAARCAGEATPPPEATT
jgi:pimeloyl-ACP methyl ester carboxylesterase